MLQHSRPNEAASAAPQRLYSQRSVHRGHSTRGHQATDQFMGGNPPRVSSSVLFLGDGT